MKEAGPMETWPALVLALTGALTGALAWWRRRWPRLALAPAGPSGQAAAGATSAGATAAGFSIGWSAGIRSALGKPSGPRELVLREVLPLGPHHRLHSIDAGGERFLIATHAGGVTLLHRFPGGTHPTGASPGE